MNGFWNLIEKISRWFIRLIFKIMHKESSAAAETAFIQFVKFGIVGVTNTVISYVLYAGSLLLMQRFKVLPHFDYLIAQVIAFVLSVLWSFYWNNKYVFKLGDNQGRNIWRALIKTYISYSFTGLFLSSVLLIFWVRIVGLSEFLAPILNLIISVPLNFIINKFWAFKPNGNQKA
jgi:putative flippase GtrA